MNNLNNNSESKWYPPNMWPHVCSFCGKEFIGRKNRDYCPDSKCKQARAYQKRYQKMEMTKPEVNAFTKTVSIFHELCIKRDEAITLPTSNVKALGVDFKATPFTVLKDEINGHQWRGVGPYEYQFSSDETKVTIRKSSN